MKRTLTCLVIALAFMGIHSKSSAQCLIDSSQTAAGIYPDTLPVATAGLPYTVDVTFVMLTDTLGLTINNYQIANVVGLPIGISWQCNNFANGCNYDPATSIYGCVALTGTPLIPGSYIMTVTVIADVQLVGQQSIDFDVPFTVEPGTVSNPGFSMQNSLGCAPLTVDFTNNNPGQLSYLWDFGDGTQSILENPPPQTYTVPGTYVVTQTVTPNTTPSWYLTEVTVTTIPDNYGGIIDSPDMYFLLYDSTGTEVYDSRPAVDNTQPPVTWVIPNVPLIDGNYVLHVWDEDGGLFGADDDLGEISFAGNGTSGTATGAVSGASGTLTVDYTIFQTPVVPLVATDTIYVYAAPPVPNITASGPLTICEGDSLVLSVDDTVNLVQWYDTTGILAGETFVTFEPIVSGIYSVVVTTLDGCTASSTPTAVTINPLPIKPTFFVNGNVFTTGVTGVNLQWYFNSNMIPGATGSSITATANGTYQLCATDVNGCQNCSDTLVYVGVGMEELTTGGFQLYPNPSDGRFTVLFEKFADGQRNLIITDILGKVIKSVDIKQSLIYVEDEILQPGVYLVGIEESGYTRFTRLVVR